MRASLHGVRVLGPGSREQGGLLAAPDKLPTETLVRWFPNEYDPRRAHLAVFTREQQDRAPIDARPFLAAGDRYRLLDPKDFYGAPITEGVCDDRTITVPVGGTFRAFVIFKEDAGAGTGRE